jgi:sarcosine oxidase subunit gamma
VSNLFSLTPLFETLPHSVKISDIELKEIPVTECVSLACADENNCEIWGKNLPAPTSLLVQEGVFLFATGKDQWMAFNTSNAPAALQDTLKTQLPEAYVTDLVDGWCMFEMIFPSQERLSKEYESLINVDLFSLPDRFAIRTKFHHMSVFVLRSSPKNLAMMTMRSQAGFLFETLQKVLSQND